MKVSNWQRYLAIAVTLLLVLASGYYFSNIVAYVLIAWVLSLVGQPLMDLFLKKLKLGRFKIGNSLSAILVLIIFFLFAWILLSLFIPLVVKQAAQISTVDLNSVTRALQDPINNLNAWFAEHGLAEQIASPADQIRENFFSTFNPGKVATFFSSIVSTAGGLLIDLFSITFITFFFLKEQGLFVNFLLSIVPNEYEEQVKHVIEDTSKLLTRYFGGILFQVVVVTTVVSIGLTILGIKNALLIGFFAALINVIPYVGPIIGAAFGIFVVLTSNLEANFYNETFPLMMKVVGVFAIMQMLDNFILQPFIFSNSVRAHPLEIFIVILMGATLNGVLGMVLAIPTYTVLRVLASVFFSEFKIVKSITGRMEAAEIVDAQTQSDLEDRG